MHQFKFIVWHRLLLHEFYVKNNPSREPVRGLSMCRHEQFCLMYLSIIWIRELSVPLILPQDTMVAEYLQCEYGEGVVLRKW